MAAPIRALSITRPWPTLILAGHKPVENRTWTTGFRGTLLIHSAQSWETSALQFAAALGVTGLSWTRSDYPLGIVGTVDLVDVCTTARQGGGTCDCGPWAAAGQCHWKLANPRPLPEPLLCKGALGLWEPEPWTMRALYEMGVLV